MGRSKDHLTLDVLNFGSGMVMGPLVWNLGRPFWERILIFAFCATAAGFFFAALHRRVRHRRPSTPGWEQPPAPREEVWPPPPKRPSV